MGKASKDKRDIYYRKARRKDGELEAPSNSSRSIQEFNIFHGVKRVVDLCAAPGSWSQVLRAGTSMYQQKQSPDCKEGDLPLIVAIDLQPMAPIEGVIQVQGVSLNARTAEVLLGILRWIEKQTWLFAMALLMLLAFMTWTNLFSPSLYWRLKLFFSQVTFAKPKVAATQALRHLQFVRIIHLLKGFKEKDLYHLLEKVGTPSGAGDLDCRSGWLEGPNKVYIPFLACGDLSGYDSDRSYPLPSTEGGSYRSLDPVQPPIAPPYKTALEMKKASSHGVGADISKQPLDS
ncbi:hypothetical protein EJB05_41061 [Eragrostis curvula]|uniref:Ribosomal RNA methyltransferase FtsJ domain-containing protein n=1 Tax=Eragrostis curvula TaxID=38414 RepID=A0A5J9T8K5_9POAL|nr:hypothetical protein EJB05_41061 [Eragrostis curvula]